MSGKIIMKEKETLTAEILAQTDTINRNYPQLERDLAETPVLTFDYSLAEVNQQEMEDYNHSLLSMINHSDATSIGNNGLISSHPRPDARRALDAALLQFDLKREMKNIKQEGNWSAGTQSAKTLVKSGDLRIVLIAMHQGNEMKMHQSNGPMSLQVMEGNIQFMTWQSCVTIKAGQFVSLQKKVQHNILAKEQSIMLLTIFNREDPPEEKIEETGTTEKDDAVVEASENINFPDFPTYPPEDDVYKESSETVEAEKNS